MCQSTGKRCQLFPRITRKKLANIPVINLQLPRIFFQLTRIYPATIPHLSLKLLAFSSGETLRTLTVFINLRFDTPTTAVGAKPVFSHY